jgi:hypothetical protein
LIIIDTPLLLYYILIIIIHYAISWLLRHYWLIDAISYYYITFSLPDFIDADYAIDIDDILIIIDIDIDIIFITPLLLR